MGGGQPESARRGGSIVRPVREDYTGEKFAHLDDGSILSQSYRAAERHQRISFSIESRQA